MFDVIKLEAFLDHYEIAKGSVNLFLKYLQMCFRAKNLLKQYYRYEKESFFILIYGNYHSSKYHDFRFSIRKIETFLRGRILTDISTYLFQGNEFDRKEEQKEFDEEKEYLWIPTLIQLKELTQAILDLNEKETIERYTKWITEKKKGKSRKSEEINFFLFLMENAFNVKWKKPSYGRSTWLFKDENYRINDFLELRLEDNHTTIYVEGKRFNICHFLLLNIPINNIDQNSKEIGSIDEAKELYNTQHERNNELLNAKVEFWGHCSNLQAWYEHNYDTRLLHSNLSFPLLKKLTEVGDPLAKKVYKDEIALRFESNYYPVVKYLIDQNYLKIFTLEELCSLRESLENKLNPDIYFPLINLIEEKREHSLLIEKIKKNINKATEILEICENQDLSLLMDTLGTILKRIKKEGY